MLGAFRFFSLIFFTPPLHTAFIAPYKQAGKIFNGRELYSKTYFIDKTIYVFDYINDAFNRRFQ